MISKLSQLFVNRICQWAIERYIMGLDPPVGTYLWNGGGRGFILTGVMIDFSAFK